ncbi:FtsQ-type POTRA domain-containing protein [Spirulina sp. CCNP1310]|nr:FtsQ-type POTRA domain-containing protein [Spirulina sp. CCNP1310]
MALALGASFWPELGNGQKPALSNHTLSKFTMATLTSTTSQDLKLRRHRLKRRRQLRILQTLWRSLLLSAMAGGTLWLVTRPNWVISDPQQITVLGNEYLSTASVRSLVPLDYPQPLLEIQPQVLRQAIEAQSPITQAIVTRRLLPPGLTIEVQERRPVALVKPGSKTSIHGFKPDGEGLVDDQGFWLPYSSYTDLAEMPELPTLTVIGLSDHSREDWPAIYSHLARSATEIFEIDFQTPSNIILNTELGNVHLGTYHPRRFEQQMQVLAEMRTLPTHIQPSNIDYIDLQSTEAPAIQLR